MKWRKLFRNCTSDLRVIFGSRKGKQPFRVLLTDLLDVRFAALQYELFNTLQTLCQHFLIKKK